MTMKRVFEDMLEDKDIAINFLKKQQKNDVLAWPLKLFFQPEKSSIHIKTQREGGLE